MLSIAPAMGSPAQGQTYFEEDSYYAPGDQQAQWLGSGARALGLSGGIKREDLLRAFNGVDRGGTALVRNAMDPERNAYLDMTFSAPKSVSILSYHDARLEKAHRRAVASVVEEMERHYAITQMGAQGCRKARTGNLAVARFDHHESRNLDPQLHSHCLVMNLTNCEDGKWRTIDNAELFTNKMFLGQMYRSELACRIRELGYSVSVTDRAKGLFEIAGVDGEILEEFSTRRKEVLRSLEKYEGYQCKDGEKAAYAALDSRRNKAASSVGQIRQDAQSRLAEYGQDLEALCNAAQDQKSRPEVQIKAEECIQQALEDVTQDSSAFRRESVLRIACRMSIGQHTVRDLERALDDRIRARDVVVLGRRDVPTGVGWAPSVAVLTTREMLAIEKGILERVRAGRDTMDSVVDKASTDAYLSGLADRGTTLSRGQREAVQRLATSRDAVSLLQGDAGSGKTFAMEHLRQVLGARSITVRGFAPTGKAADELAKAGIETATVDSLLAKAEAGSFSAATGEVWVVDESSMIDSRRMARLLELARAREARLVLIGDTKQLQSVEAGKIFGDLQRLSGTTYCEMTENRRQKTRAMRSVVDLVKEKRVRDAFGQLEAEGAIQQIASAGQRLDAVAAEYVADRRERRTSIVITSSNAERAAINERIRTRLVATGEVESGRAYQTFSAAGISGAGRSIADSYSVGQQVFFRRKAGDLAAGTQAEVTAVDADRNELTVRSWNKDANQYQEQRISALHHGSKLQAFNVRRQRFGEGDEVLFLKNDARIGVRNGQRGRIESLDEAGNATIRMGRSRTVTCNLANRGSEAYNYIDHGYALTSYKSQGATVDRAIVCTDTGHMRTNLNDFYVSMTRARMQVSVYCDDRERMERQASVEQLKLSTLDQAVQKTVEKLREINSAPTESREKHGQRDAAVEAEVERLKGLKMKEPAGEELEIPAPKKREIRRGLSI